jgi:hypothetical protein
VYDAETVKKEGLESMKNVVTHNIGKVGKIIRVICDDDHYDAIILKPG